MADRAETTSRDGPVTNDRDADRVWAACERVLGTIHPRDRDPDADRYGTGPAAERLEARVAELLGKETAVWLPSGTMAQQIALRIHAERRGSRLIAFHPHCHLDVHEERGYEVLHGLHAKLLGHRDRLVEPKDVEELHEAVAAVLLELPQRDLGGRLPVWDDLVTLCHLAREHGAALHLDGARLWQCGPFYERGLDEIAALFDTVYVSFYKDLTAPAGCALAGPREFVDEARVWLVRHGGRMFSVHPLLAAAERGLDDVLPRMPELVAQARAFGAALAALEDVSVVPDPPQAAMLHVHVRRPLDRLEAAALELAERTRTWFAGGWQPTEDPAVQKTELSIGLAGLEVAPDELAGLYGELLAST
jgi:threonine aldolase